MKALFLFVSISLSAGCGDEAPPDVEPDCATTCLDLTCSDEHRLCLQSGCTARCDRCLDGWVEIEGACVESVDSEYVGQYAVGQDYFKIWNGESYDLLFVKGVDLGVGMPGKQPGDLAPRYDDYARWFVQMADAGFNTLRVYTLHFPRFYEAFRDYNEANPDRPLYLFHGVWLTEENPTRDLHMLTNVFDTGIEEVIDAVHGNYTVAARFGRAYGEWTIDISELVIGYIIGREVFASEVIAKERI